MRRLLLLSTILAVSGCDLSPELKIPELLTPEAYKEAPEVTAEDTSADAGAEVAAPDDTKWKRVDEKTKIEEVAWWRMFNLDGLDSIEEQAMSTNPSLEVARQRVEQARGIAEVSGADLWPRVGVGFGPERQKQSSDSINASFPSPTPAVTKPYTLYTARGFISWELDLFDKNRNTAKAAERDADAEENNYRAARLALQADIAQAYIEYLSLKEEKEILTRAVKTRGTTRDQIKSKLDAGLVDDLTFANTETELSVAQAELAAVSQQFTLTEHRLAVLIGVPPSHMKMSMLEKLTTPPTVPPGLPSELLARRPDVQAAVQQIAAANARIGAARAGYLPDISLSATGGWAAEELGNLFKKPNQFWAIGPLAGSTILTQPIFEGGRLSGTLAERKAVLAGASANYKVVVLNAFREVEDNLSGLRNLSDQQAARRTAVNAGKRGFTVAKQRYETGYSSQLEYLDAERNLLAAERGDVQVQGQRYIATIQLIKALGGTWGKAEPLKMAPAVEAPKETPVEEAPTVKEEGLPTPTNEEMPAKRWYDFWS